jgi:hypothetical protein
MFIRHDRWHRINGRCSRCSTGRDHRGCVQVGALEGAPPVVAAFGHQVNLLEPVLKEKTQQVSEIQIDQHGLQRMRYNTCFRLLRPSKGGAKAWKEGQ